MPRTLRIDVGDEIYHVIHRANNRALIFRNPKEYKHFEKLLHEAKEKVPMRILAYAVMPNHWHLVLHPYNDGDLALFMHWLTLTHTQQLRAQTKTIGYGHIYQGRYKSFLVAKDNYLLQLMRYVERNPKRAKLVKKSEDWRWGSAWLRYHGSAKEKKFLDNPPIVLPRNYRAWLNEPEDEDHLRIVRNSINRGTPMGADSWVENVVSKYELVATVRPRGRPRKGT